MIFTLIFTLILIFILIFFLFQALLLSHLSWQLPANLFICGCVICQAQSSAGPWAPASPPGWCSTTKLQPRGLWRGGAKLGLLPFKAGSRWCECLQGGRLNSQLSVIKTGLIYLSGIPLKQGLGPGASPAARSCWDFTSSLESSVGLFPGWGPRERHFGELFWFWFEMGLG